MIDQVADAFKRKDYRTAAALLKQLVKQEPKNPLVRLYVGRLHEATGKLEAAETVYRQLLQDTTNPKIMAQARQGLGRVEAIEREQRQQALAQATADPRSTELGVLVLEPITAEAKQVAAQKFARIMQLDPYSARLQLPTRGWRLYRTGPVGELQFYVSSLRDADIPCFAASLADIKELNVFSVHYFSDSSHGQATVVCQNVEGQLGALTFSWSEVTQRVEGLLPLFDEVVDRDARRNLQRKTQIMDYLPFCDLHLPQRSSILRLSDRHYQFQQGITFSQSPQNLPDRVSKLSPLHQTTSRKNWNNLLDFLNRQVPQLPVWSDFTSFAQTALDYKEMLGHLPSHIDLFRREETLWDPAFQLYSGLVFLKNAQKSSQLP
ncbi:MAG TPA: tetratricopeptide repeat protein [Candidatus Sericytochromatia bacterium]|jgi:tetratricopeptide (TPR) repeat protein